MKVLLVAGQLSYSNPAIYTISVARGLAVRGHEVQVVADAGALGRLLDPLEIEVYRIQHGYLPFRRLTQFIREFGPDVVQSTGGRGSLEPAAKFARACEAPLYHTVHSWLREDQDERYPKDLAGLVTVNQALREHLVNDRNVPKSQIRVIPYGIELPASPSSRIAGSLAPVVGTVGRLAEGRRHHEFVRAAALVRERLPEALFVVAGSGPDERRLRRLSKQLKLEDALTFVQPNSSAEIFSVLDLAVVLPDWGGVGLTLLEAMSHGCPVLATGGSEVFSVLTEEDTCAVVDSTTPEKLAEGSVEVLEDPSRRQELVTNAREHVLAHYPLDAHLHSLEELYSITV